MPPRRSYALTDIENDLDATNGFNINAELAKMDAEEIDTGLMAEFKAAAKKNKK
jgi:hypothetical protein